MTSKWNGDQAKRDAVRVFSKSTCLHAWACCSCTGPVLLKSHAESSSIYTRRGVRFVAVCCNFLCVGSTGQSQRSKSSFRIQRSPRAELVAAVTPRGPSSAVETVNATRHMSGGAYDEQPDRRIRHLTDVLTKGPRTFDAVVIGAGVVGLAICRALAVEGQKVILLEQANAIGTETSSRNSEVIHSGIYYTPGSLKAKLCVDGRQKLYAYCDSHNVPYNRLGKLLVATHDEQVPKLKEFLVNGKKNGMTDLVWLDTAAAKELEPDLHCVAALKSPSTGVISSLKLMEAYREDAEQHGALLAFNCEVVGGSLSGKMKKLEVKDRDSNKVSEVQAHMVVNAAGLYAQQLATKMQGLPSDTIPESFLARGHYCTMEGKPPFKRLIYPMPESWGLGVHLTLDLEGRARFGPDVEWIDKVEYNTNPDLCDKFYPVIRQYWPGLPDGSLRPSYSGIRPKVVGPGKPGKDFVIQGTQDHGLEGVVNLYGIESPGLTSSLSIGELVMEMLLHGKKAPSSVSGGEQRD